MVPHPVSLQDPTSSRRKHSIPSLCFTSRLYSSIWNCHQRRAIYSAARARSSSHWSTSHWIFNIPRSFQGCSSCIPHCWSSRYPSWSDNREWSIWREISDLGKEVKSFSRAWHIRSWCYRYVHGPWRDPSIIWSQIQSWRDLSSVFLKKYKYNANMAPYRSHLQNTTKKDKESFKKYAQRGGS